MGYGPPTSAARRVPPSSPTRSSGTSGTSSRSGARSPRASTRKGVCVNGSNLALRAAGLGTIAGLRSMAAPAALSRAAVDGRIGSLRDTPFALLGSSKVSTLLTLFEVGELIGDKLPITPSRTSPPALLGRAASGAVVGAALFVSGGRRAAAGGVLGPPRRWRRLTPANACGHKQERGSACPIPSSLSSRTESP